MNTLKTLQVKQFGKFKNLTRCMINFEKIKTDKKTLLFPYCCLVVIYNLANEGKFGTLLIYDGFSVVSSSLKVSTAGRLIRKKKYRHALRG